MKLNPRRALPALLLALVLLFSLPMTGCSRIVRTVSRAVSRIVDIVRDTPEATVEASPTGRRTARPESTPKPQNTDKGQANAQGIIPLDEIFSAAEYTDPTVSGDGKYVLFRHIRPDGSADDIVVRNMETGMEAVVPYPPGTNGIPYFLWSADSRHVLFMIDNSGDENYSIYAVDVTTGESKTVYSDPDDTAIVITLDDANPDAIYYKCNTRNPQYFDLYWCNIKTGEQKLVMENPGYISSWYFDHGGMLRIVEAMGEDGSEHLLLKKPEAADAAAFNPDDWQVLVSWDYADTDNSGFMAFSVDGGRITYIDSTNRTTSAVMEMDLATRQTTLVDSDPGYDAASTWHDLVKDRVTAVNYVRDRSEWKALEPDIAAQFERVAALNPGDFGFTSSSSDDRYWLLHFDNDTDGRCYYYYDSQTGQGTYLFHETPALKKYGFAPMEPVAYTASDGLTVHGYATFPLGAERRDLPMVLLVHGGPQARDEWGFNAEVQWLANRGYLVLQVNFRGSTGYGKDFVRKGDREWGGKMQQDLTDAVNWAVEQGWADRGRIAIMGASYGGYAALAGAAFTPDVYACAIDMFGPSSLITLVNSSPSYWEPYMQQMYQSIGNPATDEAFMKSRSPLYAVDSIRIPVLIAQGGNDVRVTPQESEQIVSAMKEQNLDVEYLFFPNAGHGLNTTEDVLTFYSKAEAFLARHIGGRTEN